MIRKEVVRKGWERCRHTGGFGLLELMLALALTTMLMVLAVPGCLRVLAVDRVTGARAVLLGHLRYAQETAQSVGTYAAVRLALYSPQYALCTGPACQGPILLPAGVGYKDGYVTLVTGNILYDLLGDAQVGGVIRLTSDDAEADINLFIGAGVQSEGDTTA